MQGQIDIPDVLETFQAILAQYDFPSRRREVVHCAAAEHRAGMLNVPPRVAGDTRTPPLAGTAKPHSGYRSISIRRH